MMIIMIHSSREFYNSLDILHFMTNKFGVLKSTSMEAINVTVINIILTRVFKREISI